MAFFTSFLGRFGRGGVALSERTGKQDSLPAASLVEDLPLVGPDAALQISTVWNCIDRRAMVIASLPFFVYEKLADGQKVLARNSRLYQLLHDSPNSRMTPLEFWRAMMMNHDLRGNAYARIERDAGSKEAISLWPMPADQVEHAVLDDGTSVYQYRIGNDMAILAAENVLHIKNLGNGTTGLSKLDFMRATIGEARNAQAAANKVFATGGKPTGVLMVDKVLTDDQRLALKKNFAEMSDGNTSRLFVLEASMKYQQISFTPEQLELLSTRQFIIEEICRWFDVPPVLVHHSNVTTWGSGVEQIVDGWHKLSVRPMLVNIEQALTKRVLTPRQRVTLSVEINQDALLRGSLKDRAEIYAKQTQNGIMTRNEARQLENLPPDSSDNANTLTVQTNLVPIAVLGQATRGAPNAAF
jgi:HK97 family phage portal protein